MLALLNYFQDSLSSQFLKTFQKVMQMKRDTVKYAHGLKRIWVHMSFKVRYCHKIFQHEEIRNECQKIFNGVAKEKDINLKTVGFDANHAHCIADLGNYSEPELKKLFKGTSGRKLLKRFPWLKKKYFWGSGLWGRQYYCYAIGSDMAVLNKYVQRQKFFTAMHDPAQQTLARYYPV